MSRTTTLVAVHTLVFAFVAAVSSPLRALTMTFTSPTRDVALLQGLPDNNFGIFPDVQTGRSAGAPTRSLLSFDVSALAGEYIRIDSITLRLYFDAFDDTATKTTNIYAVTNANADWVEGTKNNAAEAGSSVWNEKLSGSTSWAGSAGLSTSGASLTTAGADYVSTLLASQTFSTLGSTPPTAGTPFDFAFAGTTADLTSLIDKWIDVANGGLFMLDPNEGSLTGTVNRIRYYSREAAAQFHPQLIVEFSQVPEPSTCALLGLGVACWPCAGAARCGELGGRASPDRSCSREKWPLCREGHDPFL